MPADVSPTFVPRCLQCGAALPADARQCWLCGALADQEAVGAEAEPPLPHAAPRGTFSLSTLMLFVTLVAIVCGVFSIAPGVGIAMALVMLPALTHTAILLRREAKSGNSLVVGEKILLFVGSLMLTVMAAVAAAIAFGVTSFVSFWPASAAGELFGSGEYWGFTVGNSLGLVVAAYAAYRFLIMFSEIGRQDALSRRSKLILAAAIILAMVGAMALASIGL